MTLAVYLRRVFTLKATSQSDAEIGANSDNVYVRGADGEEKQTKRLAWGVSLILRALGENIGRHLIEELPPIRSSVVEGNLKKARYLEKFRF